MMGVGSTAQICFFMYALFQKCRVDFAVMGELSDWDGGSTNDSVWSVLIWSFLALETGLHPTRDHRGEQFTTEPWITMAGTSLAKWIQSRIDKLPSRC